MIKKKRYAEKNLCIVQVLKKERSAKREGRKMIRKKEVM